MQGLKSAQAYLDALSLELCFDASLARRVCDEVRGHFEDARAASMGSSSEAQIIERFGDPRAVAAEFAPILARRVRAGVGVALGLALAGVLASMEARAVWMPRGTDSWLSQNAAALALSADRVNFIVALLAAAVFWFALTVRGFGRGITLLLPGFALGCLAMSVIADAVVAFAPVSHENVVPASVWAGSSVALELSAVAYVIRRLFLASRHLGRLASLSSQ